MCRKLIFLAALVWVLGLIGAAKAAFDTVGVYDPDDAPHHNQVDQSGAYDSHPGLRMLSIWQHFRNSSALPLQPMPEA